MQYVVIFLANFLMSPLIHPEKQDMGYLIVKEADTGKPIEILGDKEQYKKREGIPNKDTSERVMQENDKAGE